MPPSRLAPRKRRKFWGGSVSVVILVAALVILSVLFVDMVSKIPSASAGYYRTVNRGFAALADPVAADSNATGQQLASFLSQAPGLDRPTFFSQLDSMAQSAAQSAQRLGSITPPSPRADASSSCSAAMTSRSDALSTVQRSLETLLGGPSGSAAGAGDSAQSTAALTSSGRQLIAADDDWSTCRARLRDSSGSARLSASRWITDATLWTPANLSSLVSAIVGSSSLAAAPGLAIVAISTSPTAEPASSGGPVQLPPTSGLTLSVVVQNTGNVQLSKLRLDASLSASAAAPTSGSSAPATASSVATASQDVPAGGSVALSPSSLPVFPGDSYNLVLTASAPGVAAVSAQEALAVQQAISTIVLAQPQNAVAGRAVTYIATVTAAPQIGSLGGTVEFESDGAAIAGCTNRPVSGGEATCNTAFSSAATYDIAAVYSGAPGISPSASLPVAQKVSR